MAVAKNARMVLVSGFVVERTSKGHGNDNGQKDNPTDDDDVQMFVNKIAKLCDGRFEQRGDDLGKRRVDDVLQLFLNGNPLHEMERYACSLAVDPWVNGQRTSFSRSSVCSTRQCRIYERKLADISTN